MKYFSFFVVGLIAIGCASKTPSESTSDARKRLEDHYKPQIGSATKADFTSEFGNAEWCKIQNTGEETCRFYKKLSTKWMGDEMNRKSIETFDEVVADFGTDGTLRQFKANALR